MVFRPALDIARPLEVILQTIYTAHQFIFTMKNKKAFFLISILSLTLNALAQDAPSIKMEFGKGI